MKRMGNIGTLLALLALLLCGRSALAAPVITFNLPDDAVVSPADFDAYNVPGLALVAFHVQDTSPLMQVTAQGFYASVSVWLGGSTGQASGSLFWYTPTFAKYAPGEYDLTVTATDAAGQRASRTLHLFLVP